MSRSRSRRHLAFGDAAALTCGAGFRSEVGEFCDQVIAQQGKVHGKTLNAIRDRIDRFHQMNVFGDQDAAQKLARLKAQISGLTGQDLAQQSDVAAKLNRACQTLKNTMLDAAKVSQLTGRLKRRVVLD
jgi:methyl-accepting chemotaxis protein